MWDPNKQTPERPPLQWKTKKLKLPTLVYCCRQGNMLLTHKLSNDTSSLLNLNKPYNSHTRGHLKILSKCHMNTRMHQNFFSKRVANNKNSLSKSTVSAASSVTFKKSLDNKWSCRNWKYCWHDSDQSSSLMEQHRSIGPYYSEVQIKVINLGQCWYYLNNCFGSWNYC